MRFLRTAPLFLLAFSTPWSWAQEKERATFEPAFPLTFNHVSPGEKRIRLLFVQTGDRSANTGQSTCWAWARSINLAQDVSLQGPFHAAVAPLPYLEVDPNSSKQFINHHAAALTPLASKWDIPIWMDSPYTDPRSTLSAMYTAFKAIQGPTTVVIAWDPRWVISMQHTWIDGLVRAGEMESGQSQTLKAAIRPWNMTNDQDRIDQWQFMLDADGKFKGYQWTTRHAQWRSPLHGCPTQ